MKPYASKACVERCMPSCCVYMEEFRLLIVKMGGMHGEGNMMSVNEVKRGSALIKVFFKRE